MRKRRYRCDGPLFHSQGCAWFKNTLLVQTLSSSQSRRMGSGPVRNKLFRCLWADLSQEQKQKSSDLLALGYCRMKQCQFICMAVFHFPTQPECLGRAYLKKRVASFKRTNNSVVFLFRFDFLHESHSCVTLNAT